MQTRLTAFILMMVLLITACQPVTRPREPEPQPPQGLRPDAPPYAVRGPFTVGHKSLVIDKGSATPLEVSIWYPALNPTRSQETITYAVKSKDTTWSYDKPQVVQGQAIRDAAVDAAQGPYPLVVFSHGFGISAPLYTIMLEHYASHGFIVLAPDHTEQFDLDWSDLWKASIDRPRDVKQTLDYAEKLTSPSGDMAGSIDMQHVAVVGHSYGGYTALASAGAQYDLAAYNDRCAALPEDDPLTFLCTPLVPKEAEMAERAGLTPIPDGLWPSFGDPRVTAIIPMAGDSYLFDRLGLSKITIPMMALGGTADSATPYEWGSKPAYDNVSSAQKALVTFIGAEHFIFSDPCEKQGWMNEYPAYNYICLDPVWNHKRALDLALHFSTAFLLDTLKADTAAHAALLPDAVNFPGIEYTSTLQ